MISYLKVDFPEIRRKNVRFFNLVHAHKPKFDLICFFFLVAISDFFWLFSFPFIILGVMGHFTTNFAPKTDKVFFNYLCQNAVDIQNGQSRG